MSRVSNFNQGGITMNVRNNPRAFTLIELLVVISIIALLVGILLPALGAARKAAQRVACLSNVRQVAVAVYSYTTSNEDFYPVYKSEWIDAPHTNRRRTPALPQPDGSEGFWWPSLLIVEGFLGDGKIFDCPTFDQTSPEYLDLKPGDTPGDAANRGWNMIEYGYNYYFLGSEHGVQDRTPPSFSKIFTDKTARVDQVLKTSETIAMADSRNYADELNIFRIRKIETKMGIGYLFPSHDDPSIQFGYADPRHASSINVSWADGHGSNVSVSDPDNPYHEDELTDVDPTNPWGDADNNKWDLK